MAVPLLFMLGATIIRTAAPSIIRALTKQGAKKIAKPTAKQIKKAVSPNKAPKKIQDAIKSSAKKPTTAKKPASKTATDAARKKQTEQLKQGNGARKAQPPKKKPTTAAKKPTKKPDPKKKPTTTTKPNTGLTPGKVAGGLAGGVGTLAGATVLGDADKKARADRIDRQSGASRTARPLGRTDSETVGTKQKERQATLPPREKEGMGGKATVSPDQKSRQATLPRDSREDQIGVRIARMLGDKRSVDKMISDREESEKMEEEMNLRRGGSVSKKYGARAGGFTKRGGMYKKGY
jgi:DNA mismatch repair ATPase MutL|tara:strand:+ start:445 stop:1323 length:879 start_codon:yes stop_codon:yes gene_type:complete